ncbi:MAG: dihydroorotate dehydrogenase electron transfer subunit [Anaerolineae bacterium]
MQQLTATVVQRETVAPAWWQLTVAVEAPAGSVNPGQFFLARCQGCYLRRPIFPQPLPNGLFGLLLRPATDPGMAWLAARQPGDPLDLIGPLGNGFPLHPTPHNLLLVSDSRRLSPLLGLLHSALTTGAAVTLLLGGRAASAIYPAARLPAEAELRVATADGSLGQRGSVSAHLPELLAWADAVAAVGSPELYRALRQHTRQARLGASSDFLHALAAPPLLPCGVGACAGCALPTTGGPKLACADGPVFDLMTLEADHD